MALIKNYNAELAKDIYECFFCGSYGKLSESESWNCPDHGHITLAQYWKIYYQFFHPDDSVYLNEYHYGIVYRYLLGRRCKGKVSRKLHLHELDHDFS